ncbi:hypothetical protein L204_101454 [Cryptococcus depauperatus]|nr:hypothetical protein L204_04125 [Cryptococcus depauperatus CBS 7855]
MESRESRNKLKSSHRKQESAYGRDKDSYRHHERSVSPRRDRESRGNKNREREKDKELNSRSRREKETLASGEDLVTLKEIGVKEISEDDYFLKSSEFKSWLKEERGKYLDEMSSESAHKYFRKFVRRWNDGELPRKHYNPPKILPASSHTGYQWSFAERGDLPLLASVREEVNRMTHSGVSSIGSRRGNDEVGSSVGPMFPSSSSARSLGPSLPTASDRQYAHEASQDARKHERQSAYREDAKRANEIVPKNDGKEGRMEEKRAKNAENRAYRDKDTSAGLESDERTLLGDSNSFAAAVRRRDEAQARRREQKELANQDQRAKIDERLQERKQKEAATMEMLKTLAKQRFG